MADSQTSDSRPPIRTVAVVGAGVIGASWAALFLARGLSVRVTDPAPEAEAQLRKLVAAAQDDLAELGVTGSGGELIFASDLADCVGQADFVQENAPERAELKQSLIAQIQAAAPDHAVVASSTTALLRSAILGNTKRPTRVVTAHPFNPPHLIPLVEVTGDTPDCEAVAIARDFYRDLGREPIVLKREAVGHVANRLAAALWREALYIVEQGIAEPAEVDRAVTAGPGLRWAALGPFATYHLGGGEGGIAHYLKHLGPSQQQRWASLGTPRMDEGLTRRVVAGVEQITGGRPVAELMRERDRKLKAILKTR